MAITHNASGTTFTGPDVQRFRLASLRMQLRLEARGMKSSGGAIRPRIAAEFGLKPRSDYSKFIEAIEAKMAELPVAAKAEA